MEARAPRAGGATGFSSCKYSMQRRINARFDPPERLRRARRGAYCRTRRSKRNLGRSHAIDPLTGADLDARRGPPRRGRVCIPRSERSRIPSFSMKVGITSMRYAALSAVRPDPGFPLRRRPGAQRVPRRCLRTHLPVSRSRPRPVIARQNRRSSLSGFLPGSQA